jgi:hypothetical protein
MIFTAPDFLPALPSPLPSQETIGDFCLAANVARTAGSDSAIKRPPFIDAAVDRAWTADEMIARVGQIVTALCSAWKIDSAQKWHKIVAILASNTVRLLRSIFLRHQSEWSLG